MRKKTYDWIRLRGLHVDNVRIGVYPAEHERPRSIIVDLGVAVPVSDAATTECLQQTIDYDMLAETVFGASRARHYNLIETLCETIATALLDAFPVQRVAVEVHKPNASFGATPSVAIERERPETICGNKEEQ